MSTTDLAEFGHAVDAARRTIEGWVIRTPLIRLNVDDVPAEVWLKLECLQPIGSFKLRGATNAIRAHDPADLAGGVWTASAGNMAQGVAWVARRLGVPATVVMPDTAPDTKRRAVERLGARIVFVSYDRWWQTYRERTYPGVEGPFFHPFDDPRVQAGNGTIGLEILEDLPDVDTILVPWGGGGLSTGIAGAIRSHGSNAAVFAVEADGAAPLRAALDAGRPVVLDDFRPSFADGIGGKTVLGQMFDLARDRLAGSIVATNEEIARAVGLLMERNRVVAEGAGAAPVAAALSGRAGTGRIVCVVSGGNIDPARLQTILGGGVPGGR
ncbi:MAG TPA: threonine/serine dehydratase [Candidatus Limnocylindrales bacterium]|nr:threonine/serine dehydratase [Candidatus Limnocylindrales bacterium]